MQGLKGIGARNHTLDSWLGPSRAAYSQATLYAAVFLTDVGEDGSGTEVSAAGYARVAITNNTCFATPAAAGIKTNDIAIDFGTAAANWGTPVQIALVRTASGALGDDDVIYAGDIQTPAPVLIGDPFSIPIGGAVFKEF